MARFAAVATGSVMLPDLKGLLGDEGLQWDDAMHVAATRSLASRMLEETGRVAIPIASLLDLVTLPGHPGEFALSLDAYPGQSILSSSAGQYRSMLDRWQSIASGRRIRIAIEMDSSLRRFVRSVGSGEGLGRVLVQNRRELARTVVALCAAGVEPGDVSCSDRLAIHARDAWAWMEADVPAMQTLRRSLWLDPMEFRLQETEASRNVSLRIHSAFDSAFEPPIAGRRTVIVHHGFYFFTPPQWAFFQLLRETEDIDQIFVIHDDGESSVFKSWRIFFSDHEWRMPPVHYREGRWNRSPAASALRDAMSGRPVDSTAAAESLRLLECRNPSEFVREWRMARSRATSESPPLYFAPAASELDRLIGRLDRDSKAGPVDLASLPVGAFLLGVHDCIDTSFPEPRVRITSDSLIDIVASGCLGIPGLADTEFLAALRRTMPFFDGCNDGISWVERARALERLIVAEVQPLDSGFGDGEFKRMSSAARNPLRRVPWADITSNQARLVVESIVHSVDVISEIAALENATLGEHLTLLRKRIANGLAGLSGSEAESILDKLTGMSVVEDSQMDVAGLVDVVRILLGREMDFDSAGDESTTDGAVRHLRSLDELGFKRASRDLHVANLSDDLFPSRVPSIGWPFRSADLAWEGCHAEPIAVEIMEARAASAGHSDLYLLWLALDSVELGNVITLSWITEVGSELRSTSSLISLLAKPAWRGMAPEIASRTGGVEIAHVEGMSSQNWTPKDAPQALSMGHELAETAAGISHIDPWVAASALACPRRFAMQWALGDSASFFSHHHHSMLYGNVMGALEKCHGYSKSEAEELCGDLWRQLSEGERISSLEKRVIKPTRSAAEPWLLTLDGSTSSNRATPVDKAYVAAKELRDPDQTALVGHGHSFLPEGPPERTACKECPLKARCLRAILSQDG